MNSATIQSRFLEMSKAAQILCLYTTSEVLVLTWQTQPNACLLCRWPTRCQAKFLTCEIYDFTPCAHAQKLTIRA